MSEHEHRWQMVMHLDGCHYHQSSYRCRCGATLGLAAERSRKDPYFAAHWAVPGCERCEALLAGARRRPRRKVLEPA